MAADPDVEVEHATHPGGVASPDGEATFNPTGQRWDARFPGMAGVALAVLSMVAVGFISAHLFVPSPGAVLVFALALVPVAAFGGYPLRRVWGLIWRLRWFYASLVVFFGWGDVWMQSSVGGSVWLPSGTGLAEAALRIVALMVIAAWVVWLTTAFVRSVLVRALTVLLAPLALFGADVRRWAHRLFLTLAYFESANRYGSMQYGGISTVGAPVVTVQTPYQKRPLPPGEGWGWGEGKVIDADLGREAKRIPPVWHRWSVIRSFACHWMVLHIADALSGERPPRQSSDTAAGASADSGKKSSLVSDRVGTLRPWIMMSPLLLLPVLMTCLLVLSDAFGLG